MGENDFTSCGFTSFNLKLSSYSRNIIFYGSKEIVCVTCDIKVSESGDVLISSYIFSGCDNLEGVTFVGSEDNNNECMIDAYAFKCCTSLTSIIFPDGLG